MNLTDDVDVTTRLDGIDSKLDHITARLAVYDGSIRLLERAVSLATGSALRVGNSTEPTAGGVQRHPSSL